MPAILTLTMNPGIDKSSRVDNVVPERKLRCKRPRYDPGGGGINVSRAISRLGGQSVALYLAGGRTGQTLSDLLDREGLDHVPVRIEGWNRENLIVREESTGQQFRFGMPGPDVSEIEWQQCLTAISGIDPRPEYIVASGSLPPGVPQDFYARVARLAKEIGARMVLDASGEALSHALREGVFLVKPNLREASGIAGHEARGETDDYEGWASRITGSGGSEVVVISLGAAGAAAVTAEGCEHLRSPAVPVASKVGAGDCMVAGIVLSLTRGLALTDAVRFGVATGAAAVMTAGTQLCRREDAERLYKRMVSEANR